jgi:hypothetical protein
MELTGLRDRLPRAASLLQSIEFREFPHKLSGLNILQSAGV